MELDPLKKKHLKIFKVRDKSGSVRAQTLMTQNEFSDESLTFWEPQMSLDVLKSLFYGGVSTVSCLQASLLLPSCSVTSPNTNLGPISVYYPRNWQVKQKALWIKKRNISSYSGLTGSETSNILISIWLKKQFKCLFLPFTWLLKPG